MTTESDSGRAGVFAPLERKKAISSFSLLTNQKRAHNVSTRTNMTATLKTTSTMFRALADESRVRLLNLLLEGEICVCDLGEALSLPQPRISSHLIYLKRAGLVTMRQDGKWRHYAIPEDLNGVRAKLLDCVRSSLREIDVLQRDLARLRRSRAKKNRCK
jgi:ArsR family transcriptional regulator, arsenate/arsenite/antimonite-responsive transcriptional repressor